MRIEQVFAEKQALFDNLVGGESLDLAKVLTRDELLQIAGVGK